MKIIMSPHAGCYNHGCEAIVRSTIAMLGAPKEDIYLYSTDSLNDRTFGIDQLCNVIPNESAEIMPNQIQCKCFALKEHFFHSDRDMEELSFKHNKVLFNKKSSVYLSIGGDNYCYNGTQHILSELTKLFTYNHIPSVLWGCSVENGLLSEKVVNEIKQYNAITVRESLSYEILAEKGITSNVILCSDPAFTLTKESVHKYDIIQKSRECVGINISPLLRKYDSYPNAGYRNVKKLTEYILNNTEYSVLMLPHVRQNGNDDLEVIKQLAGELNNNRIIVVEDDYNCMQLKGIISTCKIFIGCRTHSTIAAYSACVPTLAIGYSVKAKGIAKDIFGNYEDLVVDVREFESDDDLLKKYLKFADREDELRKRLKREMPDYINRAYLARDAIKSVENR